MTAIIALGDVARDTISGFEGVVTLRLEYLNGCIRFGITPSKLDKDGKPIDQHLFDVGQIELVTEGHRPPVDPTVNPPGGDRDTTHSTQYF